MQQNAFTPVTECQADILDRYRELQRELADMPPFTYPPQRSCVDAQIEHLLTTQKLHMRLIELTLAGVIFFWLGFAIAVRCL